MNHPRLQIIRGLPGSGKSTLAREKWPHLLQYEFDFFCMRGGQYAFGDKRNTEGQRWLSEVIHAAMAHGLDIVVPGVFCGNGEHLMFIVADAITLGYDVWIGTLTSNYGNAHGVRLSDLEGMKNSFKTDDELRQDCRRAFGETDRIRFGFMPTDFEIAPMEDGK